MLLSGSDGLDVASTGGAVRLAVEDPIVISDNRFVVAHLEQEPWLFAVAGGAASTTSDEYPLAAQLFAVQREMELSLAVLLLGVAPDFPGAAIPEHDRAGPVFADGNSALERAVFHRMVLDRHGQTADLGIETRPLRHGPTLEHVADLQSKVVVQLTRRVFLHDIQSAGTFCRSTARFAGAAKVTFAAVRCERHGICLP